MPKTIFIIGSPRSGKTLLQSLVCLHESIGWFSQYNAKYPFIAPFSSLNKLYDIPLLGERLLKWRKNGLLPHPAELSKKIVPTLTRNGSLTENDVLENEAEILRALFNKQREFTGKKMLMVDEGRPARIRYFNDIFPNSYFIHVVKDGRSVVADFLHNRVHWFSPEKKLSDIYPKGISNLKNELKVWENTPHYQLAFAALRWKAAIQEISAQSKTLKRSHWLEVHYEDLIDNTNNVIKKVLDFIKLQQSGRLGAILKFEKLVRPKSYMKSFTSTQLKILNKLLHSELTRYNYKRA